MFFELIADTKSDHRQSPDYSQVNIHFCSYDKDGKGRQIAGTPMSSKEELNAKIDLMVSELEAIRKKALRLLP